MRTYKICLIIMLLCSMFNTKSDNHSYERGLAAKNSGNWSKALNIWMQGRNELSKKDKSDPRIAFAFIETATEQGLACLYETASKMYMECLTEENLDNYPEAIQQEAKYLTIFVCEYVNHETRNEWEKLIKEKDVEMINRIKDFWFSTDPTPVTDYNEHLIEHYERIALSIKNF